MSATPAPARRSALEQVSQRWKTAVALGSVAVVAGFVAIVVPAGASVAVALFTARLRRGRQPGRRLRRHGERARVATRVLAVGDVLELAPREAVAAG